MSTELIDFERRLRHLVCEKHQSDLTTARHLERKAKAEADLAELSLAHAKKMVEQEEHEDKILGLQGLKMGIGS